MTRPRKTPVPDLKLTRDQAAALLGVSPQTASAWRKDGRLSAYTTAAIRDLLLKQGAAKVAPPPKPKGKPRGRPFPRKDGGLDGHRGEGSV